MTAEERQLMQEVRDSVTALTVETSNLRGEVGKLYRVVIGGNGERPLLTRVALLEQRSKFRSAIWASLGAIAGTIAAGLAATAAAGMLF
jgi:hypothetical protein